MAKLPHIRNNQVAQEDAGAVFTSLYEMLLFPPEGIPAVNHLADEITNISGLDKLNQQPEQKKQKSRGHTRIYEAPFVDDTTIDLSLNINLNAHGDDKQTRILIYEMFTAWRRRGRDERTGANGIRRDMKGTMQLKQFNGEGDVWRLITAKRVFLKSLSAFDEAGLESNDPATLSVTLTIEDYDVTP